MSALNRTIYAQQTPRASRALVRQQLARIKREAFAAFAARDLERLGRTLADDVSWHTPGVGVLAGDYYGRAAVIEYLRQVLD